MRTVAYNGMDIGQYDVKISLSEPVFTGWYTQSHENGRNKVHNPTENDWLSSYLMGYLDSLNCRKILGETTDFRRVVYSLDGLTIDFGLSDRLHVIIDGPAAKVMKLESSLREEIDKHRKRNAERVTGLNRNRQNVFEEVFESNDACV